MTTTPETFTAEQETALDALIAAFDVRHSREFTVTLKVYDGRWTEAEVNPCRRIKRQPEAVQR